MTTGIDARYAFWTEQVLPISPGHDQYRFNLMGSVVKVDLLLELPEEKRAGYRELLVAHP
jgi:hypothetical protein